MNNMYLVSFRYSEKVHCTNIVITDDIEKIDEHYSKYEWFTYRKCEDWEYDSYKRLGMPVLHF